jgi:hypothetical protein
MGRTPSAESDIETFRDEEYISVAEAALLIGVCEETIRRRKREGFFRGIKKALSIGTPLLIPRSEVLRLKAATERVSS